MTNKRESVKLTITEAPPLPNFTEEEKGYNARLAKLLEREDSSKQASNVQEIILDKSNKIAFPGFPYTFEALGEKIIVSVDIFKSGYECPLCKGAKTIHEVCSCTKMDRPGKKYSEERLKELLETMGPGGASARSEMLCPECHGHPHAIEGDITCPACKGQGAIIHLLEDSKVRPVTGVVVSMGAEALEHAGYKIGTRILFGPHTGMMIPTKAGLAFKVMDWYCAQMVIEGASDMNAFDFILTPDQVS